MEGQDGQVPVALLTDGALFCELERRPTSDQRAKHFRSVPKRRIGKVVAKVETDRGLDSALVPSEEGKKEFCVWDASHDGHLAQFGDFGSEDDRVHVSLHAEANEDCGPLSSVRVWQEDCWRMERLGGRVGDVFDRNLSGYDSKGFETRFDVRHKRNEAAAKKEAKKAGSRGCSGVVGLGFLLCTL